MFRRLHFDLWYLFRPPWDSGISPPQLLEFIATHPPGRAIDLGCGTGTNVITLAQRGWVVTGVDFSPRAIRIAERRVREAGVRAEVTVGDVTVLSGLAGPFDLALDLGCFHGLEARQSYLATLDRVLASGGFWLLYAFFRGPGSTRGAGIDRSSLELIRAHAYHLVSRTDGVDKRGRPSAWFLYQRPPSGR